jgi:hypothetical protein
MDIQSTVVVVEGQQWQKDLPDLGDIELLVAPWENKAFERELQKQIMALPAGLRPDGRVDPFAYYGCVGRTISKTILFDWKNFQDGEAIDSVLARGRAAISDRSEIPQFPRRRDRGGAACADGLQGIGRGDRKKLRAFLDWRRGWGSDPTA